MKLEMTLFEDSLKPMDSFRTEAAVAFLLVAPTLSAALYLSAFPGPDMGLAAYVCLVPLFVASVRLDPPRAFAAGLLFGMLSFLGLCHWLVDLPGFRSYHALPLLIYLGLYSGGWAAFVSSMCRVPPRKLGAGGFGQVWRPWSLKGVGPGAFVPFAPLLFLAPAAWVGLDYLRAHVGFLSLSWGVLAHSQHRMLPLIQMASVTGEYGVTFLVVLVNTGVGLWLISRRLRYLILPLLVVAAVASWGVTQLFSPQGGIKVAVVQPAISLDERKSEQGRQSSRQRLERLTMEAASSRPDLVVWPETALWDLNGRSGALDWAEKVAREAGVPVITGVSRLVKFQRGIAPGGELGLGRGSANSACLVSPEGGRFQCYAKRLLVPFGEYLPLRTVFSWPKWFIPPMEDTVPGEGYEYFILRNGTVVTPIICWENMFGDFVREAVAGGAQLVAHLVNDNWFGNSPASRQHNLASVFRAVENRVPVVVASNTGPSLLIDTNGRVISSQASLFTTGVICGRVRQEGGRSLYSLWGDRFAWLCLDGAAMMVVILLSLGRRGKQAPRDSIDPRSSPTKLPDFRGAHRELYPKWRKSWTTRS